MGNRFKKVRIDEENRRKDINHKDKFGQKELCKELEEECGYYMNISKLKKLEAGHSDVKIDSELLLAYKKIFNVSADWLIDESVHNKNLDGDIATASKTVGLSEEAITRISNYEETEKELLNRLICAKSDELHFLLSTIYTYIFSADSTVLIKNTLFNETYEQDKTESKNMLKYSATESFELVLWKAHKLYEKDIERIKQGYLETLKNQIKILELQNEISKKESDD